MKPSDPDTMLTGMVRVQELTSQTGQTFSLLTCDQQLYWVAVHVSWDQPERFKDMYLRLGGMHALMSFAGDVGSLMAESGLSDILSEVFGGVPKMLSGKKFPQNVRAPRMMAEEVVPGLFMDHHFENTEDHDHAKSMYYCKLYLHDDYNMNFVFGICFIVNFNLFYIFKYGYFTSASMISIHSND